MSLVCLVAIATAKPQDVTHYENSESNEQNHEGNNNNGPSHWNNGNHGNHGGGNWENEHHGHHGNEFDKFFISFPLKANWFHAFQTCRLKKSYLLSVDSSTKRELITKYIDSLNLNDGKLNLLIQNSYINKIHFCFFFYRF